MIIQQITLPDDFLPVCQRDWDIVRASLLFEHDWACEFCETALSWKGSSIDHLIPRAQGGTDHYVNLTICCARCNSSKGARNLWQWREPEAYRLTCEVLP